MLLKYHILSTYTYCISSNKPRAVYFFQIHKSWNCCFFGRWQYKWRWYWWRTTHSVLL